MAEESYTLSAASVRLMADMIHRVRSQTHEKVGTIVPPNTPHSYGFWAKLTGNVGTSTGGKGPYNYSWTEQYDTVSGFADYPASDGGRSGTTTQDFAINAFDVGPMPQPSPLGNGTYVFMQLSFDEHSDAVWRFDCFFQPGIIFRVDLSSDGGSDGNQTTQASWTYTATTLDGVALGGSLSPEWPRCDGTLNVASKGLGYINTLGVFVLSVAFESPNTTACAT